MDNMLKAYTFNYPDYIPINMSFYHSTWQTGDPDKIQDEMLKHKRLFPGYVKKTYKADDVIHPPYRRKGRYIDSWGVEWETLANGITGAAINHPLKNITDVCSFKAPAAAEHDGWGPVNWEDITREAKALKNNGKPVRLSLRHGFMFLTLTYIRGFENFIYDMFDDIPEVWELIEIVERFNADYLERCMGLSPDIMCFPEDLGAQSSAMISPDLFKKFIKPSYIRLMGLAKSANSLIHMHSDGYILDLIDDIIECGADIINLQDLVNGIENIRSLLKDRVAIDLDIDRQNIVVFGTPKDIDGHIREIAEKLGDKRGGLSMSSSIIGDVPFENIKAVMDALEKYSDLK